MRACAMIRVWNLYPERLNRIQKAFWVAFYLVFGASGYFFVYDLLLPSRDASASPPWGQAAKQHVVPRPLTPEDRFRPGASPIEYRSEA